MPTPKHLAKRGALLVGVLFVFPLIALAKFEQWVSRGESWFATGGTILSLLPGKVGNYLRLAYYRLTLQKCSPDACFCFGVTVAHRTAEIGKDVVVGAHTILGTVTLDDHVLIGSRVSILSGGHQHDTTDPTKNITEATPVFQRVRIGSNTWIGEGAIVLADVGSRCLVAAGSVVFRPVPDGKLAMGNPARAVFRKLPTAAGDARPCESIEQEPLATVKT